jgi:hypothetical protein
MVEGSGEKTCGMAASLWCAIGAVDVPVFVEKGKPEFLLKE